MKNYYFILLPLLLSCINNENFKYSNSLYDVNAAVMGKIDKNGKTEFYSFGPSRQNDEKAINENSIFRIASMTKAIGSVAALQLVDKGLISLDEPLDKFLPEMTDIKILNEKNILIEPKVKITLRHLLTHTAGFGYWFTSPKIYNWDEMKKDLDYKNKYPPRLFESGSSFMYGTNIDWVGRLVEKITKTNLEDYFRENITGPLKMNSTWFNLPEELDSLVVTYYERDSDGKLVEVEYVKRKKTNSFNAGGGLLSSPKDYSKFLLCMLNKGKYDEGSLISEEIFNELNSPQLKDFRQKHLYVENANVDVKPRGDRDYFFDGNDNWTLGWAYEENSLIRPKGTAYWAGFYNTYFTIDFENNFAIVYMSQILPFNDDKSYNLFTSFERYVYENLKN